MREQRERAKRRPAEVLAARIIAAFEGIGNRELNGRTAAAIVRDLIGRPPAETNA